MNWRRSSDCEYPNTVSKAGLTVIRQWRGEELKQRHWDWPTAEELNDVGHQAAWPECPSSQQSFFSRRAMEESSQWKRHELPRPADWWFLPNFASNFDRRAASSSLYRYFEIGEKSIRRAGIPLNWANNSSEVEIFGRLAISRSSNSEFATAVSTRSESKRMIEGDASTGESSQQ